MHTCIIFLTCAAEPWSRQGPPLQPHPWLVGMEEAQHPQPPPLPVICFRGSFLFMLSFALNLSSRCAHVNPCSVMDVYAVVPVRRKKVMSMRRVLACVGVTEEGTSMIFFFLTSLAFSCRCCCSTDTRAFCSIKHCIVALSMTDYLRDSPDVPKAILIQIHEAAATCIVRHLAERASLLGRAVAN